MDLKITREETTVRGLRRAGARIALCTLVLISGCGRLLHDQRDESDTEFTVVPFSNSSAMVLDAEDIVHVMEIAGFTPPQIWKLGGDLRDALMQLGGAKMRMGKGRVEVIYAIQGDLVWITTRTRGLFVYDVKSKQFDVGPRAETNSPGPPQPQAQAPTPQPYEPGVSSVPSTTR